MDLVTAHHASDVQCVFALNVVIYFFVIDHLTGLSISFYASHAFHLTKMNDYTILIISYYTYGIYKPHNITCFESQHEVVSQQGFVLYDSCCLMSYIIIKVCVKRAEVKL